MWRVREAFFAIQDCPVPVIAAVSGAAVGTGLAIAASCDFIVADEDALFGLPELKVGVMGGARHLARIAPQPLMRRMFLTSENLSAGAFAAAGGAVVVCATGTVVDVATEYARRIAARSVPTVRISKQVLNQIENMNIRTGYEFEQNFTVSLSGTADAKEALSAFRERREPLFTDPLPANSAKSISPKPEKV
jgi:enoyl-CoA hydratase/carnithine racemase